MPKITRESLLPLEVYSRERSRIRAEVIEHKIRRRIPLGEHVTLIFEDEMTIRYQVQEMLRIERIFEDHAIREELAAYNPLIPDGQNLKATMMIEYPDPAERALALAKLIGVEDKVWIRAGDRSIFADADEDLDRESADKTSAVHFLRFQLPIELSSALKGGATWQIGITHPAYEAAVDVPSHIRDALLKDLA